MINLLDILQEAERVNTNELRLVSGQKPQIKSRNGWYSFNADSLSASFMREQVLALLDEEERVELLDRGISVGSLLIKDKRFNYVFSRSTEGFNAYFSWKNQTVDLSDYSLPPAAVEIFKKSIGLHLITGPRQTGRTTFAQVILQEMSEEKTRSIAVFADQGDEYSEGSTNGIWQVFPIEHLSAGSAVLKGYDFLLVDSARPQAWKHALAAAEIGMKVLLILPFANAKAAIERFSEKIESQPELGVRRLLQTLQMVVSLRLVPGIEKGQQSAYELLMLTQEIRRAVLANQWGEIENLMTAVGEKTGMRTLNQCLMNLMLRRKIDIKAGFAESPRPEELDLMLEKVGF